MKRQRMTQRERVLQLLRRRGEQGVTQADFLPPEIADGGGTVSRLSARVEELRDAGHRIVVEGKCEGYARYVLRDEPRVPASVPAAATEAQRLLDVQPASAITGWEAA